MVGFIDPNPPKPPVRSSQPQEKWWKGMFTNPIQVKRPAQGKYSPKVDERCFTWCSQTVRGRTDGQDPWCRSICIRRIFEHEVRRLTSHFSHDAAHHSRFSSSSSNASTSTNDNNVKGPELKYPLPPEGQRKLFDFGLDDDEDDDHDEYSPSRYPSPSTSNTHKGKEKQEEVKYWEEGWYIWMTKNRWAVQEKMDLMMMDLEKQAHWQRMKEQEERAWAESQTPTDNPGNGNGESSGGESHLVPAPVRQPYPIAAEESFLLRIPTHLTLIPYVSQTFQPTTKVLSIFKQSLDNGDQKELWMRGWEAARDGAPFRLVKNVVRTCLDSLKKGPKDEE